MRHQTRIAILSVAAGFGAAGVLQVAALLTAQAGHHGLSRIVDWPTTLLHALTPNDAVAILAGFPLGGAAYALVANLVFRRTLAE